MDVLIVEKSLLELIDSFAGQLPAEQLKEMADLVRSGERGIAFENLCTQLFEYDVEANKDVINTLRSLGSAMGVDPKYCNRLIAAK